jgi:hypothetical protein
MTDLICHKSNYLNSNYYLENVSDLLCIYVAYCFFSLSGPREKWTKRNAFNAFTQNLLFYILKYLIILLILE